MHQADYLEGLNQHQHQAVTAPLGHCLVLAGAGSGKTRVLVSRIAWLIDTMGISPYAILAVTFTNKAAGEMRARLNHILSCSAEGLWVGTFHGLCHRLLRRHYKEARLPEAFHILDSDDQGRIIKRVITALNLDIEQWPVKQAQSYINARKDEGLRPSHIAAPSFGPSLTLLKIYQAYEQACQIAGVIDFAELLLRAHELLRDNPAILDHYQQRFQAILVDEFQDTNAIQYAWVRLLAGSHAAVMAVGDDDQSIYAWRGAKVENIQKFSHDFIPNNFIRLEQNYRSTETILNAANALIDHNQTRMGKNLWTEGEKGEKIILFSAFNELEEARFVSDKIQTAIHQKFSPNDIAILYRSNAQSRVLEDALLHAGIAYRIHGGLRFFERAEIKDALAYLRLTANADDDAAFERVVNFPPRGLGEKTLHELRLIASNQACSLWKASFIGLEKQQFSARASGALKAFLALIESLQASSTRYELADMIGKTLQVSGLRDHFAGLKGEQAQSRLENLQELMNAATQFRYDEDEDEAMPLLSAFLAHASLEAGEGQAQTHESSVHLMTLHAAKGLEFPMVFIVGMEEGVFPGRQSQEDPARLEEERRLCYVGMTRAMQQLIISYAEIRRQYGREEYHRPSRFLQELPKDLLHEIRPQARFQTSKYQHSTALREESFGFSLGQAVVHPKFGSGVLLAFEGQGANARVQVRFNEHGTKWLVLAYANLSMS